MGQTLVSDNLFLGPAGLDGASSWYALRLQRNHFEGVSGQELLDASNGAVYLSLLDNLVFDSSTRSRLVVLRAGGSPRAPAALRKLAIEGNFLLRTSPGRVDQTLRSGRRYPRGNAAFLSVWQPGADTARATAVRIVDNVLLGRPGGREWGLGRSGGLAVWGRADVFIARNTVLLDTEIGLSLRRIRDGSEPRGRVEENLVLATGRPEFRSNLCEPPPGPSLRVPASGAVRLRANAATRGAFGPASAARTELWLAPGAREYLLVEPLAASAAIDMETFQRRTVATRWWDRDWPRYDPVLLDDALNVRPGHAACALGALRHPGCSATQTAGSGSGTSGPAK